MKKTLAILMVVALAATAVFADVTIGAWGRGVAVPIASNGDDMLAGQTASWGGAIRTGFTVAGSADNVGFQVDMNADGFNPGIGDEAKIWVKPIDMLTLSVGKIQDNTLRGDAAFGMFNWLRSGAGWLGEDFTFTRLGNGAGSQVQGMALAFAPIDGLYINAALPLPIAFGYGEHKDGDGKTDGTQFNTADVAYKNAQIGLGYTIDGIGTVKAQFIGKYTPAKYKQYQKNAAGDFIANGPFVSTTEDAVSINSIEVAFDLKAVENLNAAIGFKFNMSKDKDRLATVTPDADDTVNEVLAKALGVMTPQFRVALSGAYNMDALTINLLAALNSYSFSKELKVIGDGDKAFSGMRIDGGLGLSYALEALTVVGDVRLETYTGNFSDALKNTDKGTTSIAFLVGVEKGLGNGLVGIGFQGATNGTAIASLQGAKANSFLFAVPVRFEYWF